MFIAALSASCLAQPPEPPSVDAAVDAFAAQAIEDAVLRYTEGRHPIYRGEVVFTRGGSTYSYAVTGTLIDSGSDAMTPAHLTLASAASVAVSVLEHGDDYMVLLTDEDRSGWPSPSIQVPRDGFGVDPLGDVTSLTLPETAYQTTEGGRGTIALTMERIPASEVTWEDLVAVSRASIAPGLDLSRAVHRSQVLSTGGGRLVRGAVTGVPLEVRDSDPSCHTFYTYWRGVDVAMDVFISEDLTPTLRRIERGQERVDEQCSW